MTWTSRQNDIVGVHWALFILATFALSARFYVRIRLRPGTLGWDDWTMVLAWGLAIAVGALETMMVEDGLGRHIATIDQAKIPEILKLTLINTIMNLFGTMMVKVSICLFLLRMTQRSNSTVRWLILANMAILIPFTIAVAIVDLCQCNPISGYWDETVDAKCMNIPLVNNLLRAVSAVGVATDFFTATIPIIIVYRLQMSQKQKMAIYAILAIGFVSVAASIVKTVVINWTPKDYTWDTSPIGYWGATEHELGIFAGCLVTLRPLIQSITSHISWGSNDSNGNSDFPSHEKNSHPSYMRKKTTSEDDLLDTESCGQPAGFHIRKMTEVEISHGQRLPAHF